jgi:hypothetical protein
MRLLFFAVLKSVDEPRKGGKYIQVLIFVILSAVEMRNVELSKVVGRCSKKV